MRRCEQVARRQVRRAVLVRDQSGKHGRIDGAAGGEDVARRGQPRAFADHQQAQGVPARRIGAQQPHKRLRQHLGAVPRTERSDEADDERAAKAVAVANRAAIDIRPVAIHVDAVGIGEHAVGIDAARHDIVAHRAADHHNQVGRRQVQHFDPPRQRLVPERPAPVSTHPHF